MRWAARKRGGMGLERQKHGEGAVGLGARCAGSKMGAMRKGVRGHEFTPVAWFGCTGNRALAPVQRVQQVPYRS